MGASSVEVEERKTMDTVATLGPDMESVQQVVDREVVADCEPSSSEGISPRNSKEISILYELWITNK